MRVDVMSETNLHATMTHQKNFDLAISNAVILAGEEL